MDLPQPPQDTEVRNIIDKLAQFVARNGPEFEQMTKNKQKDNPKFSFLFGGEYFNYYQYKVTTEQAILKQKSKQVSSLGNANDVAQHLLAAGVVSNNSGSNIDLAAAAAQWLAAQQQVQQNQIPPPQVVSSSAAASPAVPSPMEQLISQQRMLRDQIRQSEQNLAAQHTVLMQQQQAQVEEALHVAQDQHLEQLGNESGVPFNELDAVLAPIMLSCTKDSISNGKGWILQHATSSLANAAVAQFLLNKVISVSTSSSMTTNYFNQKLHIIYLVNDVLHHCVRKNADELKKALESVVVPMFCNAYLGVTDEQQAKLNKLLTLWESKNNYLEPAVLEKLKTPSQSWSEYKANLITQFAGAITPITTATKTTYDNYRNQHNTFVNHALQQIQQLEQQQAALAAVAAAASLPPATPAESQPAELSQPPPSQPANLLPLTQPLAAQPSQPQAPPPNVPHQPQPPTHLNNADYPNAQGPPIPQIPPHPPPNAGARPDVPFSQPPPGFFPPPGIELPDLSRPPPGFPLPPPAVPPHPPPAAGPVAGPVAGPAPGPPEVPVDDLMPSVPYFDLPAGLMVPLIKLGDFEYKPLDPECIRLPPPAPPSERLLAAVEAFYAPPGHDRGARDGGVSVSRRIVDSDGWEKLGLYEYYRAKNGARKRKEEDIAEGKRQKSRSPSPIVRPPSRDKSPPPKKRYRSKSPSPPKEREVQKQRSRSRSRSPSPNRIQATVETTPSAQMQGISSPARNGRRSPLIARRPARPYQGSPRSRSRSKSRSRSRSRSKSRSKSRSPEKVERDRSPTPPSFFGSTYSKPNAERLDESNKGHQMLRKMGWGGAGLGVKEQGIEQPITGGEVRDRSDQYKGVGINLNDPYENFRKNKGQAFISRMKARAEERS